MKNIEGELTIVATTGGIQVKGHTGFINPASDSVKARVEEFKALKGKNVIVYTDEKGFYTNIVLGDQTITANPVTAKDKLKDGALERHIVKINDKQIEVPERYIQNLKGNDFIKASGLLYLGKEARIKGIETTLIHADREKNRYEFKARVTVESGAFFDGTGDADPSNVSANIKPHVMRMAETRAITRALKHALGLDMCSVEELGENEILGDE